MMDLQTKDSSSNSGVASSSIVDNAVAMIKPMTSAVAHPSVDNTAVMPGLRGLEGRNFDELDHQLKRHRSEMQIMDNQIIKLEESIDADQRRVQEYRALIEDKQHTRGRLLAVRHAMAKFVDGLQTKVTK